MRDDELIKIAGGTATMDTVITTFAGLRAIATEAARQERDQCIEAVRNVLRHEASWTVSIVEWAERERAGAQRAIVECVRAIDACGKATPNG